jgi:hypothetical protein
MSLGRKTRLVAFASTLAAAGALSVAATSAASAETICEREGTAGKLPAGTIFCNGIENYEVSGTLTDKKLNQSVGLKEGTFNGYLAFTSIFPFEGNISGVTAQKPFEATIKVFGIPTKVGLTFELGEANGVFTEIEPAGSPNCEVSPGEPCEHVSIPTSASLGFTSITLFGLKLPLRCKTSSPVSLPLEENLLLFEELGNPTVGLHFTGTTTFPPIHCTGFLVGPFEGTLLTTLFSGPGNTYSLFVKE